MKKRIGAVILALSTLFTVSACNKGDKKPVVEETVWTKENIREKPVTEDDVLFGSYVSVFDSTKKISSRTQMKILADGGLNFMPRAVDISKEGMINEGEKLVRNLSSVDWWKRIDEVMEENNMVYFFATKGGLANDHESTKGAATYDTDTGLSAATNVIKELSYRCIGTYFCDEPSEGAWTSIGSWAKKYKNQANTNAYVNLLPGIGYEGCVSYIKAMGPENIHFLSHDQYIFPAGNGVSQGVFGIMEGMRRAAYEYNKKGYDIEIACHPQLCQWSGVRMPNLQEVIYNDNIYLAYGGKTFIYFNYVMYPWNSEQCSDAVFDTEGNMLHQELYDGLTEYHLETRATAANINLANYECAHAYHVQTSGKGSVEKLPKNFYLMPKGTPDIIISYMEAKDGTEPLIAIMNNAHTNNNFEAKRVEMKAAEEIYSLREYDKQTGKFTEIETDEDGVFTLELKPCEIKYFKAYGI